MSLGVLGVESSCSSRFMMVLLGNEDGALLIALECVLVVPARTS